MPTIIFKTEDSISTFHGMAEGMCENARDDGERETASLLEQLIEETGAAWEKVPGLPKQVPLRAALVSTAMAVLENCADAELGSGEEDGLAPGDIEVALDGTSGQDRESYSDDQDRDSYTVAESEEE